LSWQRGNGQHWTCYRTPRGQWKIQPSDFALGQKEVIPRNDISRAIDLAREHYRTVLRELGYVNESGYLFSKIINKGELNIQLMLDTVTANDSNQPEYFFSSRDIRQIERDVDLAFTRLLGYSGLPDDMTDRFTVLVSLSPWLKSGLYITGEGAKLVLDGSFLDSDLAPFQSTALAELAPDSDRGSSILLHYLSMVIYERLQPEAFWNDFSAFHGDASCQPLRKSTPVPDTIQDDTQAVSPLARQSRLHFVAESLTALMQNRILPPASASALNTLLYRQPPGNDLPDDRRMALYQGWNHRFQVIATAIKQQQEMADLQISLAKADGWDYSGEREVRVNGAGQWFQLTRTRYFTLLQDYPTGAILEFSRHDPIAESLRQSDRQQH
ncbi:hypothetical protein, partial [Endozoicomonas sp. SESOKO4]|uniref:hypothetical protein n=1 Tax=Endozoicomonas sp. SESOKO4 TaxID=2828745 RepID=UPI0021485094